MWADDSGETSSQPTAHIKKPEMRFQTVSPSNDTKAVTEGEDSLEIITQCPPLSNPRPRSTIQRASTLPHQQPQNSPNNAIQRSGTAPNLDSRSIPHTPKKNVRGQKSPASNVSRSRVISISTDGCTTDEETIPPSPATNVSCTLSPTFGHHFPSSPHRTTPSFSSPVRPGDQGNEDQTRHRCCRSGAYEDHDHQTPTATSVRESKSAVHIIPASSSKKATITSGDPVQSTRRGVSHQHQPAKKVVWGSSSTNRPPIHRDTPSHAPRDRSESRLPPSPGGSSQLTYVSDDQRPAGARAHSTGDSDYYTPSSRNSEMSDTDPEPPRRVSSSASKRREKRRASPPPSSSPEQDYPVKEPSSPSPSLSIDSSPQNPNPVSGPSHKKRRSRYSRPPSPKNDVNYRERTQSLGQDFCHCTGPCPSCHKPRFPSPPQVNPFMFQPGYYQYLYLPPPHMPSGYHLTHYGPPLYPYPYAIPQQTGDPIPSVSSAQPLPPPFGYPMPPAPATHPTTVYPSPPIRASPAPAPLAPASVPSTSAPISSLPVSSPPVDHPATKQVPPELLEALDQFYQPPQRPVRIVDPSYDPRSPYSKEAIVPALRNW
jgi:hypothetical protein